jgi:two-component system sensor histidine kinase HydH
MRRGPKEVSRLARSFHELLERLGDARLRVAESERLAVLGKISLSVAHELRNPLSGIKMNLRVLLDHPDLKEDPGAEAILREVDRMGLYLDELMNFAPASDSRASAPPAEPTKLSELSESVLTILAGRCRHADVSIARNYPAEEPTAAANGNQIRQVMMNLMVNAVEAMPRGGTMTVRVDPAGEAVRFSVGDTGPGVQAGAGNLFEAFASARPGGVGLGLYLSKIIIERHGGRIGYDSTPVGATFWFDLPTMRNQTAETAEIAETAEEL